MNKTPKATAVILVGTYFTLTVASSLSNDKSFCDKPLEDQNLLDEKDCAKYYRCVYGRMVPKECPEKMLFNPSIGNCDLYYNVDCTYRRINELVLPEGDLTEAIDSLTRRTFVRNPKTLGSTSSSASETSMEKSIYFETKPGETSTLKFVYFPHETDPNAYYKIENGVKMLLLCEEGKIFSFDLEICARPWNV